jgi:hypothetical protein
MSRKLEGTIVLDGLIEARVPAQPDFDQHLRDWLRLMEQMHFRFSLEIDGGSFNLLAASDAVRVADVGQDPVEALTEGMTQLLQVFPDADRGKVVSSVRSTEYRRGAEVQTVYFITPDGQVSTRQRTLDAVTEAPVAPMSAAARTKLIVTGVLVAAILFGISAIWVPYRQLFGQAVAEMTPVDIEKVAVEASAYAPYFTIEKKEYSRNPPGIVVTLKRTAAYPLKNEDYNGAREKAATLPQSLALDAIATGYIRCEYFKDKDEFASYGFVRISALRDKETIDVLLPLSREYKPQRIVLTY